MILRHTDGGVVAVAQPDHALLARHLADVWAPGAVGKPTDCLLTAAHHHDDGWREWEQQPTVDLEGKPHDFLTIPMPERVAIYRRGIHLVAAGDLCAGLLTSMHFTRLLAQGLASFGGEDRRLGEIFLAEQVAWEHGARRRLGEPIGVEPDYLVLRAVDYLSLLLCMRTLGDLAGAALPPVHFGTDGPATAIRLGLGEGTLLLDPWPFGPDLLNESVPGRVLAARTFEDDASYRHALASAPLVEMTFRLAARPDPLRGRR